MAWNRFGYLKLLVSRKRFRLIIWCVFHEAFYHMKLVDTCKLQTCPCFSFHRTKWIAWYSRDPITCWIVVVCFVGLRGLNCTNLDYMHSDIAVMDNFTSFSVDAVKFALDFKNVDYLHSEAKEIGQSKELMSSCNMTVIQSKNDTDIQSRNLQATSNNSYTGFPLN